MDRRAKPSAHDLPTYRRRWAGDQLLDGLDPCSGLTRRRQPRYLKALKELRWPADGRRDHRNVHRERFDKGASERLLVRRGEEYVDRGKDRLRIPALTQKQNRGVKV